MSSTKILTVDDSKTIRLIVAKAFKAYDCVVLEADNGVVGLAVASRERPDIILLDYTMPVMDGFEVLARLRSDPQLKATPVIMLTAEAGRETVIKIAKLGVRDYLIKPFKADLVVERVGRVVTLNVKASKQVVKRYDDPIHILLVDDKPAIAAQIRALLADTPWQVTTADQPGHALDICMEKGIDIVLTSLSLPNDGGHMLFQNLRNYNATSAIPIIGLCIKTALEDQTRAQQTGFSSVVTKPIDPEDLKAKISRALKLETSYKYFQQRDGWLALTLPKDMHAEVIQDVSKRLDEQLAATVDAGGSRVLIDLTQLEAATLPTVELVLNAIQSCSKLSLKYAIVGTETITQQCRGYEETQACVFASGTDEALELLK
jgi:two-component system cell cycle response regulator